MNVLEQVLDGREDRRREAEAADDRWLKERAGVDPDEQRRKWRQWVCRVLARALQWPKNEGARERLIGQCAAELTGLAREMRGRGWLLDGEALAAHVRAVLKPIGEAQRAGKVADFWPYFRASVARYVEANADAIQREAKRTGAEEGTQTMAGALAALGIDKLAGRAAKGPSLTEVLAEAPVAAKKGRGRPRNAARGPGEGAAQLPLL